MTSSPRGIPQLVFQDICCRPPAERVWYERRREALFSGKTYCVLKRALDVVLCLIAAPLVLLIIAVCAVAIRLDSKGPVFFTQYRTGKGGMRFRMYKLRTMVSNAEELKNQLLHLNQLSYPDFKVADDPRITRVGRILRRTSLDELPQLLNVLKGEMSLVGPRPTSFGAETYRVWYTVRLEVAPGLTGLWQISGRSELDLEDRLRLDVAYVRNRSLWLDIRILLHTVASVVDGRGAS
jgi:lipopolysaccharide/colanic/teichoic acid biosynthesis glycosyltransferase